LEDYFEMAFFKMSWRVGRAIYSRPLLIKIAASDKNSLVASVIAPPQKRLLKTMPSA